MLIIIQRKYKKSGYTIGNLAIDGVWFCNTLEDTDRGLTASMPLQQIREKKVAGETAIPSGTYAVSMDVVSTKYKSIPWYYSVTKGKMPRLMNVPGFDGILFHPGNTAADTSGCILVGENRAKGKLLDSRIIFTKLYQKMKAAADRGETITVKIA